MHVQVPPEKKAAENKLKRKESVRFFLSVFRRQRQQHRKNVNRVNNMTEQWKSQKENVKKKRKFLR